MSDINSIAFALDPANVPSFLLDWEVTKRCNLDCGYCATGEFGGHDNSLEHPPVAECLQSIDFMYEYVDLYMRHKKPSQRKVVLNVYGGESLFHPDIVEILEACRDRYAKYKDAWHLTITCTTNGVVGANRWAQIVPLVDMFMMSYHAEALPKQQQQYLDNVMYLKQHNRRVKCVVMMHNNPKLFEQSQTVVEFCKTNNIDHVAKALDNSEANWSYNSAQQQSMKVHWITKSELSNRPVIEQGRACCGGRKLSVNGDLKSRDTFVHRQGFRDWYCSVNWFFLFVNQSNGTVYTNKDCMTSTTNRVEPLGRLKEYQQILDTVQQQLDTQSMPIIRCVKDSCRCGFCAPKAQNLEDFMSLIERNVPDKVFLQST